MTDHYQRQRNARSTFYRLNIEHHCFHNVVTRSDAMGYDYGTRSARMEFRRSTAHREMMALVRYARGKASHRYLLQPGQQYTVWRNGVLAGSRRNHARRRVTVVGLASVTTLSSRCSKNRDDVPCIGNEPIKASRIRTDDTRQGTTHVLGGNLQDVSRHLLVGISKRTRCYGHSGQAGTLRLLMMVRGGLGPKD